MSIRGELEVAQALANQQRNASRQDYPELIQWQPEGTVLTFHGDPDCELNLDSLERLGSSISLLGLKVENDVQIARVFVPEGRLSEYLKLVNAYAHSQQLTFEADAERTAAKKPRGP